MSLPAPFGNFTILRALGSGGGTCWAVGPNAGGNQLCVLKRAPEDRRDESEYLARFRRAAHLSRRLSHEGLAAVFDVGEVEGQPYLCEELIEGHDLAEVMQRCAAESRRIPVAAAVHIACESARTLAYLHDFEGLHLAHRKLRPSKIRVSFAGTVKVLDLASGRVAGAEVLLRPSLLAETLPTLAPEQLGEGPIDARADLYALGAILWEMLAGCSLLANIEGGMAGLAGIPREQVAQKLLAHEPPPPSRLNPEVRPELDALVMRALARTPDHRLPTAHGLALALQPLVGAEGKDATIRLMNRLFDASREREERATLLASASKRTSRASHPELPATSAQTPAGRKGARSLTPIPRNPGVQGTVSAPSATALVSHNARWLKRFALILTPILGLAVVFNIVMTRQIQSRWAAQAAATLPSALPLPSLAENPPLPPSSAPPSTEPATVAIRPAPPAPVTAAMQAQAESKQALPALAAQPEAAKPITLPQNPPRTLPETTGRRAAAAKPGPDPKTILDEARQAFESDDYTRAIKKGREALELGEGRAHAILGAAYYKLDRYEEAQHAYQEALRLDPHNPLLQKRVELARRAVRERSEGEAP